MSGSIPGKVMFIMSDTVSDFLLKGDSDEGGIIKESIKSVVAVSYLTITE
jgi:hypothetical protein